VFVRSDSGVWSQLACIKASNTNSDDWFGRAVALSADGNTLAVGACNEDSASTGVDGSQVDNSSVDSGAVYVFVRAAGIWVQHAYIKASNTGASDKFGSAISLSADGNTLAVGAYGESSAPSSGNANQNDNSAPKAGAVYIFVRAVGWLQQAFIKASNPEIQDSFGESVALSADGQTLAIGAPFEGSSSTGINGNQSSNDASNSGAVYVFRRLESSWNQQAYVKASNAGTQDLFGFSVSLSADGNTLAVGAQAENSSATGVNGSQIDNSAVGSGAAYVFRRVANAWSQDSYFKAVNTRAGAAFGKSISLSADGKTVAVGALFESSSLTGINGNHLDMSAPGSGAVYVLGQSANVWTHRRYVKASNTDIQDDFGVAVSLDANGATLAVGAYFEDSSAIGVGGNQADNSASGAGAVYVYQ
jgi:hypothetical protein